MTGRQWLLKRWRPRSLQARQLLAASVGLVAFLALAGYALDAAFGAFRPTHVMHLAAETHVDRSINGAANFISTNLIGTFTVLEAARSYWSGLEGAAKAAFRCA